MAPEDRPERTYAELTDADCDFLINGDLGDDQFMRLDAPQRAVEPSVDRSDLTPSSDLQNTAEEVSTKANAPSTSKTPFEQSAGGEPW